MVLASILFWGLIFLVQDPQAGQPDVGLRPPHSLGRISAIVIILLFRGCLPRDVGLNYTASRPLLSVLLWFFLYIFRCGKSLLRVFRLFS